MQTFPFVNYKRNFEYLNGSTTIDLGNGYSFTSKPRSPLLKEFTLTFTGYRYYFDDNGNVDYETNSGKDNAGTLCRFYESVQTYDTFIYQDEQFGNVPVRFKEPLKSPQTDGKRAVLKDFSITLKEVSE